MGQIFDSSFVNGSGSTSESGTSFFLWTSCTATRVLISGVLKIPTTGNYLIDLSILGL